MSRLKIDFETEDTNVVCELADMLRRLHGREGGTDQPWTSSRDEINNGMRRALDEVRPAPVSPFGQSMPVTAEELGFTNGVLPPNPFVAGIQLGNDLLPTNPFALDPLTPPGSFVHPGELLPPPAPPAPGVELDADGLPWDARIHSSSKGKLAKTGTWKLARNLDPALAASVTAELKAAMALPAPAARQVPLPPGTVLGSPANQNVIQFPGNHLAEVGMPADQSGVQLPPGTVLGGPAQQPAGIVPPPPPAPQPAATPPPAPGAMTFPAFLVEITKQQAGKKLTFDEVIAVLKEHGLGNLQLLTARPDLIPPVYSRLEAIWTSR